MVKKIRVHHHKTRNFVHFRRPKTLIVSRKPKFVRKATNGSKQISEFDLIRYPVTTESAMQKIEKLNTLVFIVDRDSNKPKIKQAIEKMYNVKIRKVNTLITPNGEKKAFIRLQPNFEAVDVANKIGIV